MRKGRRLALDVGSVRIGVAVSDPDAILASPLESISRVADADIQMQELNALIEEISPIEIYVGDPTSLSGNLTSSTHDSRLFAAELAKRVDLAVLMIDERLTTVTASNKLRESGKNTKLSKALIDSASAVEILDFALNTERVSGRQPGVRVEEIND